MNLEPLYLVGPTAVGKSALAIELAERLGGEIVNADAFQLYQGMDICTAKPSAADKARVPHHLFGVIPLGEICDAQRYSQLAQPIIAEIKTRGLIPIITGGSGLYIKSLTHGLAPLPSDLTLRKKLIHLTDSERIKWLIHRDENAVDNVNLKNDRHVSRALEICLLSGRPQSELRRTWRENAPIYRGISLIMDRAELNDRIHQRVLNMIDAGLVEEVRNLPTLSPTAEKAIGVREIQTHLRGEQTLQETITAIQIATRQYARRQEKWFKRETGLTSVTISSSDSIPAVLKAISAALPDLMNSK
ncbi:MAG: tRNA (adenosine(37)-N6)-dimethylallyltransferase MiaA [Verrucomicrobia bacterium]|nr:tRNA (adenosine(37)-N6)-dimethylallyltransferase MiaA [Verrucomicrobiota bacterium]